MKLGRAVLARAPRHDRWATWLIRVGGFGVVVAMIGIFVEIIAVTIPLFGSAGVQDAGALQLNRAATALLSTEDGQGVAVIYPDATVETIRRTVAGLPYSAAAAALYAEGATVALRQIARLGRSQLVALTEAGRVDIFNYAFEGAATEAIWQSQYESTLTQYVAQDLPDMLEVRRNSARDTVSVWAWWARTQSISLWAERRSEDWGGSASVEQFAYVLPVTGVVHWIVSSDARALYTLDGGGRMAKYSWDEPDQAPTLVDQVDTGSTGTGRLGFALGEISVLVSSMDGGFSGWFAAPDEAGLRRLQRIHTFAPAEGIRTRIVPTGHDKTVYSLDVAGIVRADHLTSERRLFEVPARPIAHFSIGARGDWLHTQDRRHKLQFWAVDNAHPEVSLRTLFGKVWYEGYDRPAYVWQSSSGSNDFEPKLSLIPLIFGTAKATFYALLFSVPLALMSAMYVSQLMGERARRYIKPAVEVMAAFPSVVIGFLAAIWVAPLLQSWLMAFFTALVILPMLLLIWLAVWYWIGRRPDMARRYHGAEIWVVVPVILAGAALSVWLAPSLESRLFGGDIQQWIFDTLGGRYDQRNSIVIAFALGFAVIPLIFTMADDAMTNVPKSLTAASLALGATRWQTIWKVVLPSASPGIFAAIMIGFGRAVGETMIVLMAAGNTPIMDGSFLNGMRTLSANIAVEVPEAPHGGTLFRVLFLSAVLLFVVTFIANSAAEIVRQRLRNRYGRF